MFGMICWSDCIISFLFTLLLSRRRLYVWLHVRRALDEISARVSVVLPVNIIFLSTGYVPFDPRHCRELPLSDLLISASWAISASMSVMVSYYFFLVSVYLIILFVLATACNIGCVTVKPNACPTLFVSNLLLLSLRFLAFGL